MIGDEVSDVAAAPAGTPADGVVDQSAAVADPAPPAADTMTAQLAALPNPELQKQALSGSRDAQIMLAARYYLGHEQVRDPALALHWTRRAAQGGDQQAQYLLGHFHMAGIGTEKNVAVARFWYQTAHDAKHPSAEDMLARLPHVDANLLRENVYAYMSDLSNGRPGTNHAIAFHAPTLATTPSAKTGPGNKNIHSYETGLGYELGIGGRERNPALAVRWFRKAAEQGYAPAQHKLGVAYMYGKGATLDHKNAAHWFQRAALQGYVLSQRNLAMLYMNSADITQRPRAYAWLSVAARSGEHEDNRMLEIIARQMSQEEIETGRQLAAGLIRAFRNDRDEIPLPVPLLP